jgi:hypothetical protein
MSTTFLRPPKPKAAADADADDQPAAPLTDAEKKARITRIDPTERKLGYAAAALAGVIALITFVPFIDNPALQVHRSAKPTHGTTCPAGGYHYQKSSHTCIANLTYSRSHWIIELAILLVFALAVYATTRIARRAALAFTTLMTGLALMTEVTPVLAFPFIFLGGWLMIRAWRVQRYGSPTAKNAAGASTTKSGTKSGTGSARPSGRTNGARPAPRNRRNAKTPSGPVKPTASKRYTPKTPPRRKIPPPT